MKPRAFRDRSPLNAGGTGHGLGFGPNLTPMVDVVMVILIFFMAATSLLGPEWFLPAGLADPQAAVIAAAPGANPESFITLPEVTLTVRLDTQKVAQSGPNEPFETVARFEGSEPQVLDAFVESFRAAADGLLAGDPGRALTIVPADGVPWDRVIAMHEAASEAGFRRVILE